MDLFGTPIERGTIISVTEEGARVASTDRPGIVTMPLRAIFRKALEVHWPVFFLENEDGSGVVISHQNPEVTRDDTGEGMPGPAGKSAYELWLEDGNTGTLADYFESLRGPAGRDGQDGGQGPQGIPGIPGTDATVTKAAVENVLTGTISTHNHSGTYALAAHNHTKANITDFAHTHPLGELTGVTPAGIGAAAAAHTHVKANITDFPASLPASDVYAWAKAATKPAYTAAEVGAAVSGHNHSGVYVPVGGDAYPLRVGGVRLNMYWSGQGGQPTWLWGGEDGTNMYVYNPANFSVALAANADKLDGFHHDTFVGYRGWDNHDANTVENAVAFTYGNNAPHTGALVTFSPGGYELQFSSAYTEAVGRLSFRTRNGDTGAFHPWREVFHTGNTGFGPTPPSPTFTGQVFHKTA